MKNTEVIMTGNRFVETLYKPIETYYVYVDGKCTNIITDLNLAIKTYVEQCGRHGNEHCLLAQRISVSIVTEEKQYLSID